MARMLQISFAKLSRYIAAVCVVCALVANALSPAAAGTTGVLSGTLTDARGAPLAGVTVDAVSPSGRHTEKTDSKGFYSFAGVEPDTYVVSFELAGYQSRSSEGIVVFADQVATVNASLQRALRVIGGSTVRATAGGAFQPSQTADTYSVTTEQIRTLQGKTDSPDEATLLSRLPGAELDISGYPVLRGGRQNEEGYQYDGVEQTSAFLGLSIDALRMNSSVGQLQLTPGPGDASSGNAGTGVINLIAKRGRYPSFASLDLEAVAYPYGKQFSFEYGTASRDGRLSNYFTYLGSRNGVQYGGRGALASDLGVSTFYKPAFAIGNDLVDNLVYKFGKKNSQSLQLLYQNQMLDQHGTYGSDTLSYASADSYVNFFAPAITGLTQPQFQQLVSLYPGQTSVNQKLGARGADTANSASHTIKLEYTNAIDSSTFFSLRAYESKGLTISDGPFREARVALLGVDKTEGGTRDGFSVDATKQLSSKHLIHLGAKYETNIPDLSFVNPLDGVYVLAGVTGDGSGEIFDFINPANPNPALASCPIDPVPVTDPGRSYCGYLTKYLGKNPGPIPALTEASTTIRQDHAFYLTDNFAPSRELKIEGGLRFDGSHYQFPATTGCNSLTASTCQYAETGSRNGLPFTTVPKEAKDPLIFEPRLAVSYRLSRNDAVRASYGRSVEFAPINTVDQRGSLGNYSSFAGIPSYDVLGALAKGVAPGVAFPSMKCGVREDRLCSSYAEQVYWANQVASSGIPIQPVKPETFTNFDFSYSHQFGANVAVKITPFYRRGYDALATVASPLISAVTGLPLINPATGQPQYGSGVTTNLGSDRSTGVEFQLTKVSKFGLSGSVSATYINEFSNVIPTTPSEDLLPNIPPASLALGNQYRVGFISPVVVSAGLAYQTVSGFRVNPVFTYDIGYPIGAGNTIASTVNGRFVNIPNTNATAGDSVGGVASSPNYVDPMNPGTVFVPNINSSRGSPERSSAGGTLSTPSFNASLTLEYSKPKSGSTVGVQVTNLFNQLYNGGGFAYNDRYQPIATGISGPQTGYSAFPVAFPNRGVAQYGLSQAGNSPYRILSNLEPTTVRFYYQLAL